MKDFVSRLILENRGKFEEKRSAAIPEYGMNGMTVNAALKELEKIELTRFMEKPYQMDHSLTRTFPEEGTVMRDVMLDRLEEKGT